MGIFKALFGGIASFFGIIFGGLIDTLKGAFGLESEEPVVTPSIGTVATVAAAVVADAINDSTPAASTSAESTFTPAEPASPLFAAASAQPLPSPRRRPGAAMTSFMDMARDIRPAA